MDYERYAVVRTWVEPEVFRVVFIRKETSWATSGDLTESELRVELKKMGLTPMEVDFWIKHARANPF